MEYNIQYTVYNNTLKILTHKPNKKYAKIKEKL